MGPAHSRLGPILLAAVLAGLPAPAARAQRFLPDDPVRVDRDDLPIPQPGAIQLSRIYDTLDNSLRRRPKGRVPPAQNVNTLGEVPDSSWWTNRIGVRPWSISELAAGPNRGDGPETSQPWTVIGGKSAGITPGFTIRDSRGDVYYLKFDPREQFGLSTGADVIGSRLLHAIGYFVPENRIVYFRREQLRIAPGATLKKKRPMREDDLDRVLAGAARLPDGRLRCVASRALPGRVVGPHQYHGTRLDDPNDVFPHEHRRELRGYRVFCAWLNHDDSRSINSLDTYVGEPGRGHLVHYMQDFSSILGSGSDWRGEIAPQGPRSGNEYLLERGPVLKTAFSLGIWQRPWHAYRYQVYPQVGRIEAERFDPDLWKPEYPNPAFERMLPEDAFWAARIVARFSDEAIRAVVAEGDFRAPEAERHLAETIARRRDKVLERYFRMLNPLGDFAVSDAAGAPALVFVNHGEDARLGSVIAYAYQWFAFDNATGALLALGAEARTRARSIPLPADPPEMVAVRIRTEAPGAPAWQKRVDVFLSRAGGWRVVGVDRES